MISDVIWSKPMKTIIPILLFCAFCASSTPIEDDKPKPQSLLDWLRLIEHEEFRTLAAVDQHDHYFAIKTNADGKLLVAAHRHSSGIEKIVASNSVIIETLGGEGLFNGEFDALKPAGFKYTRKQDMGDDNKTTMHITLACQRGAVYGLKPHDEKFIRVKYIVRFGGEDKDVELLNQVIALP